MKHISEIIWVIFIISIILYSCTDRHISYEVNGIKHEIWIDKPIKE